MKAQPRQEKVSSGKPLTSRGVKNANNMTGKASSPSSASGSAALVPTKKQPQEKVADEVDTSSAAEPSPANPQNTTLSSYGSGIGYGGSMMGMGMMPGMYGGMGMYGMGGMMGYGMGMMPGSQWIFSLNQFLFSIQSVIFSLGQAVQIVGMNAQQIRVVYESIKGMVENAFGQVNEWGKLSSWEDVAEGVLGSRKDDAKRWILGDDDSHDVDERREERGREHLSENERIRKRRLAAFRWTLTLSISYILYRSVRRLIRALFLGGDSNRFGRDHYNGRALRNEYSMMPRGRGGYQYGNMNRYGGSGHVGGSYYDAYSPGYGGMGGYY